MFINFGGICFNLNKISSIRKIDILDVFSEDEYQIVFNKNTELEEAFRYNSLESRDNQYLKIITILENIGELK